MSLSALKKTVNNKSLRFARPNTFNDPLDASPFLLNYNWKEFLNVDPRLLNRANEHVYQEALSTVYVCSLSKTYFQKKSYLLWSHYANHHSGVCFEIDFSKYLYLGGPSEVSYPIDLAAKREEIQSIKSQEFGLFLMTNKSNVWKYEKEVRLICDTKTKLVQTSSKLSPDQKYLYVNFDPRLITKVIFGCNCDEDKVADTIQFFKKKEYSPLFEQMIINPVTLKLVRKKLRIRQS